MEPEIKKCLDLPSYLSLSPQEIGLLRPVLGNTPSPGICAKAEKLARWCESMKRLIRLSISEFCVEIHELGGGHIFSASHIESSAKSALSHKLASGAKPNSMSLDDFLQQSTAKPQGDYSKNGELPTPTEEQFESYAHPHAHRRKHWQKLNSSWRCPICRRSKFECFRSTPKSPSTFHGNVYPKGGSQIGAELSEKSELHICHDCNDFPKLFKKYLTEIGRTDLVELEQEWFLNADVVRKGIAASSHQRHTYELEKALRYLNDLLSHMCEDIEVDF
jgi:hypothetical protein